MNLTKQYRLFLAAAFILLSLSACSFPNPFQFLFGGSGSVSPTNFPAELSVNATPLPELTNLQAGLQALDSYRAVLRMDTKASSGGPTEETTTIVQEVIKSQDKFHSGTSSTGNPVTAATVEYFEFGSDLYLLTGQGGNDPQCSLISSGSTQTANLAQTSQALSPDQIFGPIRPAQLIASGEMLNGVLTNHYTVDEASMGLPSTTGKQGEIWIAQDGGYVVRYTGQAQGVLMGSSDTGQAQSGISEWSYEVQSINSLTDIPLAPACLLAQQVASSIPIPDDATNKSQVQGTTTFDSSQTPQQLADFYEQKLAADGWNVQERIRLDSLVILNANRSSTLFEITLSAKENGTTVMIQEK